MPLNAATRSDLLVATPLPDNADARIQDEMDRLQSKFEAELVAMRNQQALSSTFNAAVERLASNSSFPTPVPVQVQVQAEPNRARGIRPSEAMHDSSDEENQAPSRYRERWFCRTAWGYAAHAAVQTRPPSRASANAARARDGGTATAHGAALGGP